MTPRLEPPSYPVGGLTFCEEIQAAVLSEIDAAKLDLGLTTVSNHVPTKGRVQAFRSAQLPACVVLAFPSGEIEYESCGYLAATIVVTWVVQGRKVSVETAYADVGRAMLNIAALFKNMAFDGSVRLCPTSGHQSWITGVLTKEPEQDRKDPFVVTAQGTMNVRVVYLDPMR